MGMSITSISRRQHEFDSRRGHHIFQMVRFHKKLISQKFPKKAQMNVSEQWRINNARFAARGIYENQWRCLWVVSARGVVPESCTLVTLGYVRSRRTGCSFPANPHQNIASDTPTPLFQRRGRGVKYQYIHTLGQRGVFLSSRMMPISLTYRIIL